MAEAMQKREGQTTQTIGKDKDNTKDQTQSWTERIYVVNCIDILGQ